MERGSLRHIRLYTSQKEITQVHFKGLLVLYYSTAICSNRVPKQQYSVAA